MTSDPAQSGLFDQSHIHSLDLEIEESDFERIITDFVESGEKTWVQATVTIDGTAYRQVGVRLKGNFSLTKWVRTGRMSRNEDGKVVIDKAVRDRREIPFLIKLDQYIENQNHFGETEIVLRANYTKTALNEAVSLALLNEVGLASQRFSYVRFSLNGGAQALRLVVEQPNESWTVSNLGKGNLYKADSTGDYSYRGPDQKAYGDAWRQDAGENGFEPLIEFLDFINNADDEKFSSDLPSRLDVEKFAKYLAFHELVQNDDDIDGVGNNSYLYFDDDSGIATVVSWDLNMAFRVDVRDESQKDPLNSPNILVRRFSGIPQFSKLVVSALESERAAMFDSGLLDAILERLTTLLRKQASDLVDEATIVKEAADIADIGSKNR